MFNYNKLLKSTFVYTLLGFLPMASAFVLTPVYTKYLSPEEYGIISLSNLFNAYLSVFVAIGIDSAFSRFYFKYKKEAITKVLLSTALISMLCVSAILYLLFLLIGNSVFTLAFNNSVFTYSEFGHFIFITTSFACTYTIISQYYRDSENLKAFMWLALLYFVLVTCGTFLGIVVFKGGAQGSIIGKMLGTLLTMIFYLLLFFIRTGFKFKMRYARQMYIYGYPLVAYALLATTFDSLDRFFLNKNFSLGDLGQYNLAFVVASTIGVFLNSMQAAISPNIYKLANSNDPERHKKINSIYNYMLWATFFTVVCCIAVSYPFIYYYINPKYHSSLIYIPLLAAAFISRAYFMIYANPLFIHGKTLSLPIISIASVTVGVIANIILIRAIGIIGICFAVLIIKFTQALLAALYTKKVGLYDLIEYDLKSIHISFIIIIFSITIISTNIIPDIFGLQLKYILPLIIFTILFFVFNPQIKNIFKKSS